MEINQTPKEILCKQQQTSYGVKVGENVGLSVGDIVGLKVLCA